MSKCEQWKDIEGYEGRYQVSNQGRVKSLARLVDNGRGQYLTQERVLAPKLNNHGYYDAGLSNGGLRRKYIKIHRLVAKAFNPDWTQDTHIDHIDGNKLNNHISNLDCVTLRENTLRGLRLKGKPRGTYFNKERKLWQVEISENNKSMFLGRFETKEEAQQVFFNKYIEIHGVQPWQN